MVIMRKRKLILEYIALLVKPEYLTTYMESRNWGIHWGSEGHPSVITQYNEGSSITEYYRFGDEGMEPFVYPKWFSHNDSS
ncbi:hypothetical protein DEU40_11537 [Chryseobacterium sp. AG844]|nr:hypothetical protein DEU40_11537 [Chryseobacterium sp. AG844]